MSDIAALEAKKKRIQLEGAKGSAYTIGDLIRDLSHFDPATPILRWYTDPIEKDEGLPCFDYDIPNAVLWYELDSNDHQHLAEFFGSESWEYRRAPQKMESA